jgi:uncharacterized repeat protein (TIGR01451 family)
MRAIMWIGLMLACGLTAMLAAGAPPLRSTQLGPASPEPPLADAPRVPPPPPPHRAPSSVVPPRMPAPVPGTPCPDDPPAPRVQIRVRVPATVVAGQEIEYKICVENSANAPAHHVLVRGQVPPSARYVRANPAPTAFDPELIWELGTLEGCACKEIFLTLAPTGTDDVRFCARVQFEHGQCVTTQVARPALALVKRGPPQAQVGETLRYCLQVTNVGGAAASGIVLGDSLPVGLEHSSGKSSLTWDIGALAPGESRCIEYQVVARAAGKHCNKAIVTAPGGLREEVEHCVIVAEARLDLTKVGPARRFLTQPAVYHLTVVNSGSSTHTNVVLRDPLPANTTFVSASEGGQLVGNEVQWNLGSLEPGAKRTVDVVLKATRVGRVCNRATAATDRGLTAQAEACTDFEGVPALLLEVVDNDDPVEVGARTSYTIIVRNQGSLVATNLRLVAYVPEQLAITRVTGPADHKKDGNQIAFEPLTLQPQAEARYVVHVQALRPGDLRFVVEMTADQLGERPVREEESTRVYVDIPNVRPSPQPEPPGNP